MRGLPILTLVLAMPLAAAEQTSPNLTLWRGQAAESFTSEVYTVKPFDRAVLSWNSTAAASFEIEVNGAWHLMGEWGPKPRSKKTDAVDVDTLVLAQPAGAFRFRVQVSPSPPGEREAVSLVAVAHWLNGQKRPFAAVRSAAWGKTLDIPQRSQGVEKKDPGAICSPTSVAMVLQFHGINKTTREVADGVFDHGQKIYGNWPFNTAFAFAACPSPPTPLPQGKKGGSLESFVARFSGLEELEAEIAAGRPVIIGHKWNAGELDGAPIKSSDGHLIVVVGFTEDGDIVANDPAAKPGSVRRTYKRRQFYTTWLERGCGIAYVIRKP